MNIVYTINEHCGIHRCFEALKAAGKERDVLVVSVDSDCTHMNNVKYQRHGAAAHGARSRWPNWACRGHR